MSEEKEIPKGWTIIKLGEICFTTSGGTPSRKVPNYYGGTIPWVKSGELDKGLILATEEKITEEGIKNSSAKLFPKGTLLIALYGATIGKLAFLGIDATTNQAVCGIHKSEAIELKFLYYYLTIQKNNLIRQSIGGAQPNISQSIIKNLKIPLPPLPEQHRIVAKIEELFSSLDKGIESLKTAQAQLKVYRQAVLKWAFEGKLTNPNVKDGELPEGWKIEELKEVTIKAKKVKVKEQEPNKEFLYIDIGAIDNSTLKIISHKKYQWKDAPSRAQQIMEFGDTLFSTVRTYLRNITYVDKEIYHNQICSSGFTVIRANKTKVEPKYLFFYSTFQGFINLLNKLQTGTSYPAVRDEDVFSQPIKYPVSLIEQQCIVSEIESRLSVCDKIEESIATALQQAEALRQSILKKAFEGKLVPQDPNDEPATVLLERIKAEKEKPAPSGRKVNNKKTKNPISPIGAIGQ
jgi:type I restriction enzyme S subunit